MAWTPSRKSPPAPRANWKMAFYANLGIGIPTLVANYIPDGMKVTLQSENGMLGMGPFPYEGEEDPDLINAGKQTITELPITSYFSSSDSFAHDSRWPYRPVGAGRHGSVGSGRHRQLDDPRQDGQGYGGAMDLVAGVKKIVVVMEHTNKAGESKILKACTLPLTGTECVDMIVSDLCVFTLERGKTGLTLIELAPGVALDEVARKTQAKFTSAL